MGRGFSFIFFVKRCFKDTRRNVMKKLLIMLAVSLLSLVGCNEAKNVVKQELTLQQAVEQIGTIVDKRNALDSKIEKSKEAANLEKLIEEFDQSLDSGNIDKKKVEQILNKSTKIQQLFADSKSESEKMESEAKKMAETMKNKLPKEEEATVQKTFDQLLKLISIDVNHMDSNLKYFKELNQVFEDIKKEKEPADEKLLQLETESENLQKKVNEQVKQFNQIWNSLHNQTRGTDLQNP